MPMMTFDELYESLRNLAEENKANGFSTSTHNFDITTTIGPISSWLLRPDQIEVLITEISNLKEENEKLKKAIKGYAGLTSNLTMKLNSEIFDDLINNLAKVVKP